MTPIRPIRRVAAVLAGLACAWLGIAMAAPAAFAAMRVPPPSGAPPGIAVLHDPPGWNKHPPLAAHLHQLAHQAHGPVPVHTAVVGGMPGWQIALIAAAAALIAATVAVRADRARAARRKSATAAA
jgi:hypothetical protein